MYPSLSVVKDFGLDVGCLALPSAAFRCLALPSAAFRCLALGQRRGPSDSAETRFAIKTNAFSTILRLRCEMM